MEHMSTRKIRIKLCKRELNLPPEFIGDLTVIAEVTESKDLYKNLSTNPCIEDWDFVDEVKEEEAEVEVEDLPEEKKIKEKQDMNFPLTLSERLADIIIEDLGVMDYNTLSTLLETILVVGYKSPEFKFDTLLFRGPIKNKYSEVATQPISSEHALCKMVLLSYYNEVNYREALIDVINKIEPLWKEKKIRDYPTLASLTYKLFKKYGKEKD